MPVMRFAGAAVVAAVVAGAALGPASLGPVPLGPVTLGPVLAGHAPPGHAPPGLAVAVAPAPSDRFVLPVDDPAVVLTPFRPPEQQYGSGHRGVDLAAVLGSPVLAAGPGTVVYAGLLAGRGVVSIQHAGGLRTTYEPVTATVASGQQVLAGQVIGTLDAGHATCAPQDCLHWGARLPDGSYLDPMSLLRPWRVRLKPWDLPP